MSHKELPTERAAILRLLARERRRADQAVRESRTSEAISDRSKRAMLGAHAQLQNTIAEVERTASQLRESERSLHDLNETLQTQVAERTRDLLDAKERAEKANRAKSDRDTSAGSPSFTWARSVSSASYS